MEGILIESLIGNFGFAVAGLTVLAVIAACIRLAGMAEAERAGERFPWAEWPLPGTEEVAPTPEVKVRLAA